MKNFSGIVIRGIQCQKKKFKTANIEADCTLGVFTCETNFGYGIVICVNPGILEIHILGFDNDIYGQILHVNIIEELDKELLLKIGLIINGYL